MKYLALVIISFLYLNISAQEVKVKEQGIITANLVDAVNNKAIPFATISLLRITDSVFSQEMITEKDGTFIFENLPNGYYRLSITASGYSTFAIDSIFLRDERFDFDLNEIKLNRKTTGLQEVVIYVEKPLIENKDGKITFNSGESALSSGATTTELLKQTPLVNVDPDGKILLRGKDVKILIDDKPVQLDARQLQDLLESMPGSMIEKIEVMTTPPPQYANERGGVINIITKKGRVGLNARIVASYGTRGEAGINGNIGYKKNKLAINFSAGFGYNEYEGNSYSNRQNIYADSTNFFNTKSVNTNNSKRPNARLSIDYDFTKQNSLNFTGTYNSSNGENESAIGYINMNRFNQAYKLSNRFVGSSSETWNPNFHITYTHKGKIPGELLRMISGINFNASLNDKHFFQQFLNPDLTFTGIDSTQLQETTVKNHTLNFIINYDRPLKPNKWSMNLGTNISRLKSHNILNTEFLKKPELVFVGNELLSNDFKFAQDIMILRAALRYDFKPNFYINAGLQEEFTQTNFMLEKSSGDYRNSYWSTLPFLNLIRKWENDWNLTFSYKRTIQRPGLYHLNPSIEYSDPYNTRSGNPFLKPYFAHNFDLISGRWNKLYNFNFSAGYNELTDIYSAIRKLEPDGKTLTTWQNISGRKEFETSAWGGYTISKKSKVNLSVGYTYNVYSLRDRTERKFRNGGSLYSTLNGNYIFSDLVNSSASFTFNRFANPQGTVRSALSMNVGVQRKFLKKKVIVNLNVIDPFSQQANRTQTFGPNFNIESVSYTRTRNFRISVSYLFSKKAPVRKKNDIKKQMVKPVLQTK
ncbi:MAG: outer membrane beta-barrel protein [Chitinophagaceae bacterium]